MTGKRDSFSKLDVTVTLSGEEWLAVLARLDGFGLSPKSIKIFRKLRSRVLAASSASLQQEGGGQ